MRKETIIATEDGFVLFYRFDFEYPYAIKHITYTNDQCERFEYAALIMHSRLDKCCCETPFPGKLLFLMNAAYSGLSQ